MKVTEYLYGLLSGVNPETGEVVDLSDPNISKAMLELALLTQDGLSYKKDGGENLLQYPSEKLFNELKTWRLEEAHIQGLPAYYIFSDRELREIANGDRQYLLHFQAEPHHSRVFLQGCSKVL